MLWRTRTPRLRPLCDSLLTSRSAYRNLHVLYFGRENFSCEVFKALHGAKDVWSTLTVATTPDQRVGRGRKTVAVSPLKQLASSLNVPVLEVPSDAREFASWKHPSLTERSADNALITASFARAISESVLGLFEPSLRLNVHPSLLPKFRGAAPIQRTIMSGTTHTGVSILQMEDVTLHGFDSGPIWAQSEVTLPASVEYEQAEEILAREGCALLVEFLRRRSSGKARSVDQDHSAATRARMITARTANVDWEQSDAAKLDRFHRAISHQRKLYTTLPNGALLHLIHLQPITEFLGDRLQAPGEATYDKSSRSLIVRCANNTFIAVSRLQTEGRKDSDAHEWWNGIRSDMKPGGVLKLCKRQISGI